MDTPISLRDGYYISGLGDIVKVKIGEKTILLNFTMTSQEIIFNRYLDGFWFAPGWSLKIIIDGFELAKDKQDPSCVIVYNWLKHVLD